jgi:hypothetical protein
MELQQMIRRLTLKLLFIHLVMLSSLLSVAQSPTPHPIFQPIRSTPAPTATSDIEPTPNAHDPSLKREHHFLNRPIAINNDNTHWVDQTYPYGGTQWGTKDVHLGVEFVNPRFTPVLSAADGEVVYAGSDADFLVGPFTDYYGNVVIIAHDILSLDDKQVFTLYGHLNRVEVETGDRVTARQRIGRVGYTGIALGPHLHFEVRVDDPFDYMLTRNPELWLQYYEDHGMLAGFVHTPDGEPVMGHRLVVRSEALTREVFTYGSDRVNIDPIWQENFTVGDLPVGEYEIVMLDSGGRVVYRETITIEAYKTTFVDILLDE